MGVSDVKMGSVACRKGIQPGEGAVREVAAFLLDHGHFAGVPPTALVSCRETSLLASRHVAANDAKIGSLQVYFTAPTSHLTTTQLDCYQPCKKMYTALPFA